jgi:hypothetical protein
MSGLFPNAPLLSAAETDARPVCAWVKPSIDPKLGYARTCAALPPGMPDCLEVTVACTDEGIERTTAVIYGHRTYLIHYALLPLRRPSC